MYLESETKQQNAVFRAVIDGRILKELFRYIQHFSDEPTFKVTNEGFELRALDPQHVYMLDLVMPIDVFDEYEVENEGYLCVDLSALNRILRSYKKPRSKRAYPDPITLESDGKQLKVSFQGSTSVLPILTYDAEFPPRPEIGPFNAEITIKAKSLLTTIKTALEYNDVVKFEANSDQFTVKAIGDLGEYTKVFDRYESEDLIEIESNTYNVSHYNATILKKLLNLKIAKVVKLSFNTDQPLQIEWLDILGGPKATVFLAPHVYDDYEPTTPQDVQETTQEDFEDQKATQEVTEISEVSEIEKPQEDIAESEVSDKEVSETSEIKIDFEGFKYVLIAGYTIKVNSLRELPGNLHGQVWKLENGQPIRIL